MGYIRITFVVCVLIFSIQCCSNITDYESNIIHSARTAYLTGENITAENLYKKYLQEFPNGKYRFEAWERIYDITTNLRKDKISSLPLLDAMLMEYASDRNLYPQILKKYAILHLDLFQNDESIKLWLKYIGLTIISDSEKNNGRLQLSKQYLLQNNFDSALLVLRKCNECIDSEGFYSFCKLQEAEVLFRMNQIDAATSLLQSIRRDYPKQSIIYLEASFLLGDIFEIIQNKSDALEMFESILASYPNTQAVRTRINNLKSN